MKKLFVLFTLCLAFTAMFAQSNQENRARQKAEAAARQCVGPGELSGYSISSSATLNLYCDYLNPNPNYAGYSVEVWGAPNCPPNMYCIQIVRLLATVLVDCQGNVYNVQCYGSTPN